MLEEKLVSKEQKEEARKYAENVVEGLTEYQLKNQGYSLVFKLEGNFYSYDTKKREVYAASESFVKSFGESVECVRELFDLDSNGYLLGFDIVKTE